MSENGRNMVKLRFDIVSPIMSDNNPELAEMIQREIESIAQEAFDYIYKKINFHQRFDKSESAAWHVDIVRYGDKQDG